MGLTQKEGTGGPDLSANRWVHGSSDASIFRTITQGVAGNRCRANAFFEDSEVWAIVAYLSFLGTYETASIGRPRAWSADFCPQWLSHNVTW